MPLPLRKLADCRSDADRWAYYAEVYAWRIVRGYGSPDDAQCPVDPKGEWYNPLLIDEAVSRFRRIIAAERRAHEEAESRDPDVEARNRRYARAAAWRAGKLDAYDAVHHPDLLAKRGEQIAKTRPMGEILDELGITSKAAE